jgi:hypothetical protein
LHLLTTDEHRQVVDRLVKLATPEGVKPHPAGMEYTSLMVCFLLHSRGSAESLLALHARFGEEWFPATTGYVIVRSLFEVDVLAHFISRDREARSKRYIAYEHVLNKRMMDAVARHRASPDPSWADGLKFIYDHEYAPRQAKIDSEYARVRARFEDAKGKPLRSWSGKSIREMAVEVDHAEAYDVFYAALSSFTHASVNLANRFLRLKPDGISWTQRADEFDVASVFRYGAIFLTCLLEHFGAEFGTWTSPEVQNCWRFPEAASRKVKR